MAPQLMWQKDEIEYLKENYGRIPTKKIYEHFHYYKIKKIQQKAGSLGLTNLYNKKHAKWSHDEVEYLLLNYGKVPIEDIYAKLSNYNKQTISNKVYSLGIGNQYNKRIELSQEEFILLCGSTVEPLEEYHGWTEKHLLLCKYCNSEFLCSPHEVSYKKRKSCGCVSLGLRKGNDYISGKYFSDLKVGARNRNLEFSIDLEYITNLLIAQEFKCALTGWDIAVYYNKKNTASLDRIDSDPKIGYIPGNVQWLHKDVNKLKLNITQDRFLEIAIAMAIKQGYIKI
jgi:uncharacterized protein (DUF433 family)